LTFLVNVYNIIIQFTDIDVCHSNTYIELYNFVVQFNFQFKEVPFESLFTKVKFLDGLRVTYVCFGECHGAAITAQGNVVIWGSNIYSQRGKLRVSQNKPNILQLPGYSKAQVLNYYS